MSTRQPHAPVGLVRLPATLLAVADPESQAMVMARLLLLAKIAYEALTGLSCMEKDNLEVGTRNIQANRNNWMFFSMI